LGAAPDPWQLRPESVQVKAQEDLPTKGETRVSPPPNEEPIVQASGEQPGKPAFVGQRLSWLPAEAQPEAKAGVPSPQSHIPSTMVTAVWGEEKFSPGKNSYSSCGVGPFSVTSHVLPGENVAQAQQRLMRQLEEQARVERDRKIASFLEALKGLQAAT
jgi:hypothetical protein